MLGTCALRLSIDFADKNKLTNPKYLGIINYMYTPASFRIDSEKQLSSFVRTYSFATLVTHDGQQSHASHLPMLLKGEAVSGGKLQFHMARANPQWQHLTSDHDALLSSLARIRTSHLPCMHPAIMCRLGTTQPSMFTVARGLSNKP